MKIRYTRTQQAGGTTDAGKSKITRGNGTSQDPEKAADWERLVARAECSFL